MKFASEIKVIHEGGTVSAIQGNNLRVANADAVTILLTSATDFKSEFPTYKGSDPVLKVKQTMDAAASKSYDELMNAHLEDYQAIFRRVELDIGGEVPLLPTNEWLQAYRVNSTNANARALEALLFQYGRYLLIASSREGSLPANLQGVWNDSNTPIWRSDYHTNVNVQMNYWPAMITGMSETYLPMIDFIDSLREPGRITAREYMGVEGGGWMVNVATTPFGHTAPSENYEYAWDTTANAWLSQGLWDYYEYTQDDEMLRTRIYPIMKETAEFFTKTLVEDPRDGELVVAPSYSSEHGPMTVGTTYDQEFVWQLFTDMITASEIVGEEDTDFINLIKDQLARIDPIDIGSWGQIKEWKEEDIVPIIHPLAEYPTHRHVSHLVGVFPGRHVTRETPEYLEAAKISLEKRGYERTGWSRAQKMNTWARLYEGDKALRMYEGLIKERTMSNLLNTHAPFQIDGSLGLTSGVAEMLLQSHAGYIEPLAALPSAWSTGSFKGLVARGNFEVDADWSNSLLERLSVLSRSGKKMTVRYPNIEQAHIADREGNPVHYTIESHDQISLDTEKGQLYVISLDSTQMDAENVSIAYESDKERDPAPEANIVTPNDPNLNELRREYYRTFGLLARDYSTKSWERLQTSVVEAKEIMKSGYNSIERVNELALELSEARLDLEERHQQYRLSHSAKQVIKTGAWTNGGSTTASSQAGDRIKLAFVGEIIELYGVKGNNRGIAKVYIDGVYDRDVNFYSASSGNTLAYRKTDLASGKHTIELEVAGKSEYSAGNLIELREFKIFAPTDAGIPPIPNLALNKPAQANDVYTPRPGYGANYAVDGSMDSRWATNDNLKEYTIEIDLESAVEFNEIIIFEAVSGGLGERIGDYGIEVYNDGAWKPVDSGYGVGEYKTIGFDNRLLAEKVRFSFKPKGTKGPTIWEIEIYNIPDEPIEAETETILTGPDSVNGDQTFTVKMGLDHVNTPAYALDIALDYDADRFELMSADSIMEGIEIIAMRQETDGKIRLIAASGGADYAIVDEAQLLALTFRAKSVTQNAKGSIAVTKAVLGDAQGNEYSAGNSSIHIAITNVDPGIKEDMNGDGKVSVGDLAMVAAAYGKTSGDADWEEVKRADLNGDGIIDLEDLVAVAIKITAE